MEISNLTLEQLRLVVVVYTSSIVPLLLIPYLYFKNIIPNWILKVYVFMFFACALGWELWFTYGWCDGVPVNLRRAEILNHFIPLNINWLLNSLADAGTIALGGLYITNRIIKDNAFLLKWQWKAFFIMLFIFIFQNIIVELFLYHDQLSEGKTLSWAPLSPLGKSFNPLLFLFNGRSVMFQNQIPWILMTPIFYLFIIYYNKNRNN